MQLRSRQLVCALVLAGAALTVFVQAFEKGTKAYLEALREPDAWAALKLTLLTAAVAVPLNTVFGVCAAWAVAKFNFRGKNLLVTPGVYHLDQTLRVTRANTGTLKRPIARIEV